jgi:DNA recombination protein RmuC
MVAVIVIVIVVMVLVAGFVVWESREGRRALHERLEDERRSLQERLEEQRRSLQERMERMDGRLDQSLENTASRMKEIGEELRGMRDSATQILDVGRSISSLQDILRPPKVRGGLGEMLLARLLEQILPKANYRLQHRFRSGEAVDAAIDLGLALVPVDAKFPLESFARMSAAESEEERARVRREFVRAVKGHIDSVAKYIRPDEGTFDFALMYIPAENVYYEIIVKGEGETDGGLQEYALERRVIPVSPNSFYAYLRAIVLGLRGLRVEREAQQILGHLGRLKGDFGRFRDEFGVLGRHLTNARNKYDDLDRKVERFGDRLAVPLKGEEEEQLSLPTAEAATAVDEK